jgi:protein subunit release factor B
MANKQLIISVTKKDLEVQHFMAGGKGGQNQNKRMTGVRIIHKDSGAVAECREERSQKQNQAIALKRLSEHPKFKLWVTRVYYELMDGKTLDEKVDEELQSKNIKVEGKNEQGKWVEI